jgi:hypothetical protein
MLNDQDIEVGKVVRPQLAMRASNASAAWKKVFTPHVSSVAAACYCMTLIILVIVSSFMVNKWLPSANLMVTVFKFTKMGKRFISSQGNLIVTCKLLACFELTGYFLSLFLLLFVTLSSVQKASLCSSNFILCISGAFLITLNMHLGCRRLLRKISKLTGNLSICKEHFSSKVAIYRKLSRFRSISAFSFSRNKCLA